MWLRLNRHNIGTTQDNYEVSDNEFVSILGPSGSGKTTLLNVIGGLDRYDTGDLVINGISTKEDKDRDWDAYRNHTIGFVFQSYNLIPHQTILSNVELALTIGGISRNDRKERARKALEEVGLGDQLHKKQNQMSGGQMQRVAIARALASFYQKEIQIQNAMDKLMAGRTSFVIAHRLSTIKNADLILVMKDGDIVESGNHAELLVNSENIKSDCRNT